MVLGGVRPDFTDASRVAPVPALPLWGPSISLTGRYAEGCLPSRGEVFYQRLAAVKNDNPPHTTDTSRCCNILLVDVSFIIAGSLSNTDLEGLTPIWPYRAGPKAGKGGPNSSPKIL